MNYYSRIQMWASAWSAQSDINDRFLYDRNWPKATESHLTLPVRSSRNFYI